MLDEKLCKVGPLLSRRSPKVDDLFLPAFVDTEFTARGAEPVDGQQFDHLGPVLRPPVTGQLGGEELFELELLKCSRSGNNRHGA